MDYFLNAIKNKYADFNGRARRSEFWFFYLFTMLAVFGFSFLGDLIRFPALGGLVYLGLILPYIAVGIRRMHDVGKSGWFLLIPIYNLILAVTEGTPGTNEYGPNPKEVAQGSINQF